ncbi:MAG: glycosyltransferase family 2 protein [Actinomycetota bacterium]|nr:glycosyltransferase family 2 protein [Actinomycetota bacterium]
MDNSNYPRSSNVQVDLLLPCLDEAAALPAVLTALPAGFRAIVVDNGSTDGSQQIALSLGAVVVHEPRRGYGAAVHAGLLAASATYVAVMDCDGSIVPADIAPLLASVIHGDADLACGRRRPVHRTAWPWHARWGNHLLARLISVGAGSRLRDIAPVRVARRTDLLELGLIDRRCGYPLETVLRAAQNNWRISEFDIDYHPRAAGTSSKISGTGRGTATVVQDFAAVLLRSRRRNPPVAALTAATLPAMRPLRAGVGGSR